MNAIEYGKGKDYPRLSMRLRIPIVLLLVLGVYIGIYLLTLRLVVYPRFVELDRERASANAERCLEALRSETQKLERFCAEWAAFDEAMPESGKAPQKALNGLAKRAFGLGGVDFVCLLDAAGHPAWSELSQNQDLQTPDLESLYPELVGAVISGKRGSGILGTAQGPLLFASQGLKASDNSRQGVLIVASYLNPERLTSIARQARLSFRLEALGSASMLPDGDNSPSLREREGGIEASLAVKDVYGRPAFSLVADYPRDFTASAEAAIDFGIFSILLTGSLVFLFLWIILDQLIVSPLKKLTEHIIYIRKHADLSAKLGFTLDDELGTLAREFDLLTSELGTARKELEEKSYRLGMAEMASTVLHNVRNALSPFAVHLDLIRRKARMPLAEGLRKAVAELASEGLERKRREDLCEFVRLGLGELNESLKRIVEQTDKISSAAGQIESFLFDHDRMSRADRPLEPVRPGVLVREAWRLLPEGLTRTIRLELEPELQNCPELMLNAPSLRQVFAVLLANAAESMLESGRPEGEIQAGLSWQGQELVLSVKDQGAGIAPEALPRLFERGFSSKNRQASGLGLHWCANLLLSLGGELRGANRQDAPGAVFELALNFVEGRAEGFKDEHERD